MTRYIFGLGIPYEENLTVGTHSPKFEPTARLSDTGIDPASVVYREDSAHAKPTLAKFTPIKQMRAKLAHAKHAKRGFNVRRR